MAIVLNDTFTDADSTLLTAHTGDSGVTWAAHPANPGEMTITSNQVWGSDAGILVADVVPTSDTYTITGTFDFKSNSGHASVFAYLDPTVETGYLILIASNSARIYRRVNGVQSELGRVSTLNALGGDIGFAFTVAPGRQYFAVTTLNGTVSVERFDTNITGPGRVGVGTFATELATSTTGVHVTDIAVTEIAAPVVDAGADDTAYAGQAWTRNGSFTDDDSESWTATVDYDDSAGPEALTLNPDNTFTLSHAWASTGTYNVVVTVEDDDGLVGSDTVQVTVGEPPTLGQFLVIDVTGSDAGAPVVTLGGGA